jgi:hypothetical protein
MERTAVQDQTGQNLGKTKSQQNKLSMVAHSCNPGYAGGEGRRILDEKG